MFTKNLKLILLFFAAICTMKIACAQSQTGTKNKDSFASKKIDSLSGVNDFENMFTEKERSKLAFVIDSFGKKSAFTFFLVTVNSSMTNMANFDNYVNTLSKNLKNEDAITIGISKNYRRIRISNGADVQPLLSNEKTKAIVDHEFIPYYKNDEYFNGTLNGIYQLMNAVESYKMTY